MTQQAAPTRIPAGYGYATLETFVGQELGTSDWLTVDQSLINQFADCTLDHQWIHVDTERARRESPFGGTVAHGFLTLSLLAKMLMDLGAIPADVESAVNVGVNNVRFKAPVLAGDRVRTRVRLLSVEPKGASRKLMITANTLEIEGRDEIALSGELAAMLFGKA